jgi:outer membrane murein-binding lipoprotein Lpp
MSSQKQKLEQCSADVRACREDIRKSGEATAQLNSKVDTLQEGLSAVLRILG